MMFKYSYTRIQVVYNYSSTYFYIYKHLQELSIHHTICESSHISTGQSARVLHGIIFGMSNKNKISLIKM